MKVDLRRCRFTVEGKEIPIQPCFRYRKVVIVCYCLHSYDTLQSYNNNNRLPIYIPVNTLPCGELSHVLFLGVFLRAGGEGAESREEKYQERGTPTSYNSPENCGYVKGDN